MDRKTLRLDKVSNQAGQRVVYSHKIASYMLSERCNLLFPTDIHLVPYL